MTDNQTTGSVLYKWVAVKTEKDLPGKEWTGIIKYKIGKYDLVRYGSHYIITEFIGDCEYLSEALPEPVQGWQPIETAPHDIDVVVGHPSYDSFPVAKFMLVPGEDENGESGHWFMWTTNDESKWEDGTLWPDLGYIEPSYWIPLPPGTPTQPGKGEVERLREGLQSIIDYYDHTPSPSPVVMANMACNILETD